MLINKLWKTHKIGIATGFQEYMARFFNPIKSMTKVLNFYIHKHLLTNIVLCGKAGILKIADGVLFDGKIKNWIVSTGSEV